MPTPKTDNSQKVFITFLVLGILALMVGLISIIASNWYFIPTPIKLIGNFTLLLGLAWGITKTYPQEQPKGQLAHEILLLIYVLMCMASIGLLSQIYNLGGKIGDALSFWCAITLPVLFLSRKPFLAIGWTGVFLFSNTLENLIDFLTQYLSEEDIVMSLPLIFGSLTLWAGYKKTENSWVKLFRFFTVLSGLFAIYFNEFNTILMSGEEKTPTIILGYILAGIVLFLTVRSKKFTQEKKLIIGALVTIYTLLFFCFHLGILTSFVELLLSILLLLAASLYTLSFNHTKTFYLFALLIGLKIITVYFNAFSGLLTTGVHLMIIGAIILSGVTAWYLKREKIQKWIKGLQK